MKILILSFYYPPDLSAGSFRTAALVSALQDLMIPDLTIDILTTQPNRYSSMANDTTSYEDHGNLRIKRISLPNHSNGMLDQARAFLKFARETYCSTRSEDWDIIYATTSRLMTGALAGLISKRSNAPLYLDVRDLFSDTMADVFRGRKLRFVLPIFSIIERWTFKRAQRVNIVSEGFMPYLSKSVAAEDIRVFTNGIDSSFLSHDFEESKEKEVLNILYAGNVGEGQGLHRVIPQALTLLQDKTHMTVIGSGGQISNLVSSLDLNASKTSTITVLPPVPRNALMDYYSSADVLFLHLNDYDAFRKVLPSKIFEYAATGKPIVAGVGGYAALFLKEHVPGTYLFDPCDVHGMVSAVTDARAGKRHFSRAQFCDQFARSRIMKKMALDLLQLG